MIYRERERDIKEFFILKKMVSKDLVKGRYSDRESIIGRYRDRESIIGRYSDRESIIGDIEKE